MKNVHLSCHCGAVRLHVAETDPIGEAVWCDCSMCRRRGAAMLGAPKGALTILQGAGNLGRYQFGTNTAEHFFCKTCGVYTHHHRRVDVTQVGLNLGCIEGIDPRAASGAAWTDGINHPSDRSD